MRFQIIDKQQGDKVVYTSQQGTDQYKVAERCGRMNFIDGGRHWRIIRNGSVYVGRERIFSNRFDIITVDK